ncbi:hypothetical protein BBJ29_008281 [Phytophthora kernoviae]|uniref:FYVE-type domain-containing protein n=1 Tax=Phytophthora kernoviae TaxID=325452 RepID=A0A3F2RMS0_9STRA|nr:hypothetical protein BBJ29_008281 [Phytophthora kernoviae]RLN60684.1 hypothetical protein BBP00_00005840 [Phytophthora kernoviae]
MKFPLPKNIFPPLELTENQELNYEQLANALIKATLAEYDQFVMHDRKRVDARRWKPVRTRDEIAIYRERLVDGVRKPSAANLALYQSAISTTSSRPSHQRRPGSESSDPAAYHTTSFNGAHSFGPPTTPKKKKLSSLDLDPTENSRDTTGDDSYSSNGLLMEPRITTAAFSSTDDHSEGLPRMLAVGNLRGSLDDVMYGVVSPNASSVRLRSSYLGEYIADCSVLREMKRPSPADPFRFLGIKWFVRAKHRGAARIVLPRDFVVLEFSGVMMRPDNSRVGFHLMHSVQIPTCRELHEHRILRAKVSSCYIFEETRTNRVQVFMTASVDPSGHVIPRMALRSAATALSNCWKSVACAHNKKLAYCLQNERPSTFGSSVATSSRGGHALGASVIRSSRGGLSALTPVNESAVRESSARLEPVSQRSNYNTTTNRRQCGVCRGKLGMLSKTTLCQLCCEQMCNRCRVVRKLSSDTLNSQVTQSAMNFCKKCVASVSDESALEIARQELWNTCARGHVLSLADLGMEDTSPPKATAVKKTKTEEPVVLDHRLTMTIRSLRHLDYVLSVGESDLVDELDNEYQSEEEEDFVDVETEDEEEGRSSYASSVAVMDEGYESCDTPTSDMAIISQREAPIVEGDEPEEGEVEALQKNQEVVETESEQQTEQQAASDKPEKPKENHETEKVAEQAEEQSKPQEVRKEPEQEDKKTDESQQVEAETEPAAKEKEEKKAESTREHDDAEVHEAVAIAEEIEVVEAAPIAEVHAMMLSDYETQKTKSHDDMEEAKPRLHRAHTTVPSSGENYQHQLFQQMQDLHSVAETTYQVARANTEAAFKERDSGRVSKTSPTADSQRGVRTFSQPFAFNVVGLRSTRAMTVGISK